ncbi:glycoside hydrolase family 6 protein [uncultured Nocardioides sp.]|uniref:glycoside hydrolase family 6 protein n=1 Tax=uncultured Nocardioides sp. TaxID=198441 RepID=UPI00260FA8D5|nr:glycoside hydrolase family 6 protein [uncultured Nocardioides sp.]
MRLPAARRTTTLLAGLTFLAGLTAGAGATAGADPDDAPTPQAGSRYDSPVVKAHPSNRTNPLAGRRWGVYKGPLEQAWPPYENASGTTKKLLAEIALRPKAKWFGDWVPANEIEGKVRDYVRISQAGNPRTLVQMALFAMEPWGEEVCRRAPNAGERATYRRWIAAVGRGIGSAHTAVVLQPDLLVARCGPQGGKAVARMVAAAAKTLSARPNTSVYIDAGAYDWPPPSRGGADAAVNYLVRSGVRYARGFSLNGTHYSPLRLEVTRAGDIADELRRRGIGGKKAIISTSSNGKGFEFGRYDPQSQRDNARTCRSRTDKRMCVMLGAPPSMDPDNPRWGLSPALRRTAARTVDGYLWFGRPWLYNQADPFVRSRALDLARSWRLKP